MQVLPTISLIKKQNEGKIEKFDRAPLTVITFCTFPSAYNAITVKSSKLRSEDVAATWSSWVLRQYFVANRTFWGRLLTSIDDLLQPSLITAY